MATRRVEKRSDQDEGDQHDAENQSYRECGALVECVEGKTRRLPAIAGGTLGAYGLSGFENKA